MPHGYRRVEGWRAEYRKTNTATAIQTIARTTRTTVRVTKNNTRTITITIRMTTKTITRTPMGILKNTKISIRMTTKSITTTTDALAKLSGSLPNRKKQTTAAC